MTNENKLINKNCHLNDSIMNSLLLQNIIFYRFRVPVKNPASLSLHQNMMFIANLTSIWRMNKDNGNNVSMIVGSQEFPKVISGAKVFSQETQPLFVGHPCTANNGDCQKLCYAKMIYDSKTLKRQCGCEDSEILLADGKRCSKTY